MARAIRPDGGVSLGRVGRGLLLAIVALALAASLALGSTELWTVASLLDTLTLLACALFAWRGWIASVLLMGIGLVAGATGSGLERALVLAAVFGLVLYTCTRPIVVAYAVVIAALTVTAWLQDHVAFGGALALAAIGVSSAAIGLAARRALAHRLRLEDDVAHHARETELAVEAERQRMTDELHDIVVHDITIVAMHARALGLTDDPARQEASVRAISEASSQALVDIRRLLRVAPAGPSNDATMTQPRTLLDIAGEIQARLRSKNIPSECVFQPDDAEHPEISLNTATTLAQVARELTNNVIVHAPDADPVRILVTIRPDSVGFSLRNPISEPKAPGNGGGYGLARMQERVRLMGGAFSSEPAADGWLAEVSIPRG